MPEISSYNLFYWSSITSTAMVIILIFQMLRLKRQMRHMISTVESTKEDISVIKKRIEKLNIGDIDSEGAKSVSEKMTAKYDF